MDDSLQQIEDYYISQGLKGGSLRSALANDTKYQALLKERKAFNQEFKTVNTKVSLTMD